MQKKLPTASPTRWNFASRLSITVKEYTNELCAYLKNTIDDEEIWCSESVIKACGSLVFHKDFEIIFLLKVFSDVNEREYNQKHNSFHTLSSLHPHRKRPKPPRSPTQGVPPKREREDEYDSQTRPQELSIPRKNSRFSILPTGYNFLIVYT
jgi:hypothetical protein